MSEISVLLYTALRTDVTLQGLLDSAIIGGVDFYFIWNSTLVPSTIATDSSNEYEVTSSMKTINFYLLEPEDLTLSYGEQIFTINCRGPEEEDAKNIQNAGIDCLNRNLLGESEGFMTCSKQVVIPPSPGGDDNYNAPVEVTIKSR